MDAIRTVISELAPGVELKTFEPCARYYELMDFLLYLCEDVAYRADRIDPFLTLLWHPSEDRAIGVKLKGCRFLFDRMRAILGAKRIDVAESRFFPFVQALEVAMTAGLGAKVMADAERQRLEESYEKARVLVESVEFDGAPFAMAA